MRRAAAPAAALVAAACSYGVTAARFAPAMGPTGLSTTITTSSGEAIKGELLEVRETGLLVGTEKSIVYVPYSATRSARFQHIGLTLGGGRAPSEPQRDALRLLSRFPQGLSPPLLRQLLEARGQSEPRQIR
jgi:hypothetical protein